MEVREGLRSDIGKGLQWLRKSLALTQYQLAALAQLDYRHYQNIETGRVEVKVDTLNRICAAIGVALSTFFCMIDRKPWLIDKPSRSRGGGELYVFRIEHEQAQFKMREEVKSLLNESGHDLSEGHRENLDQFPHPCFETDQMGRCLWKNKAAADLRIAPAGGHLEELFAAHEDFAQFAAQMEQLFKRETLSIYKEKQLRLAVGDKLQHFALVGLRPFLSKGATSLYIACVDISAHVVPLLAENEGALLQNQLQQNSTSKQRLLV